MYVEIQSTKGGTQRIEMDRLVEDCQAKKLDIVIFIDINRLKRDTVEMLENYRALQHSGVRVIFDENGFDTDQYSNEFISDDLDSYH